MENIVINGAYTKKADRDSAVKTAVFEALRISDLNYTTVGSSQYVVPVEVDGETIYCGISLTAKNNKATKTAPAFDVTVAAEAYAEKVATATARANERAAAKAAKIAKAAE